MPRGRHLSIWRTPRDSAAVGAFSCYFSPFGRRRIFQLTLLPSSDPSSPSTLTWSNTWGGSITERPLIYRKKHRRIFTVIQNGKYTCEEEDICEIPTGLVSSVDKKSFASKRRPLWRKMLFGSKKMRSIILLNVMTVIHASNIPVVKEVEAFMDPAAFSAVRFVLSAIPFLPFIIQARNDVQTRNAGLELGLWISLGYLIEALGLLTSDAGRASFISLFTVIVVPVLESILGEIVPARTWFGVLMSVIGIGMLECSGSPPNVGDLLNFLSAIFFGIHTLRTEHISRKTRKENFLALLGYEVSVVALLSMVWFLVGGSFNSVEDCNELSSTSSASWDWMLAFPWIPALYTGAFSTGLGLWAEIAAMREVSATETAVIYGLEPLWGAGFAWFLLEERWGFAGWIGAVLILGGSFTAQMYASPPSESKGATESAKDGDLLVIVEKQKLSNKLSASPVIVSSRKDSTSIFK